MTGSRQRPPRSSGRPVARSACATAAIAFGVLTSCGVVNSGPFNMGPRYTHTAACAFDASESAVCMSSVISTPVVRPKSSPKAAKFGSARASFEFVITLIAVRFPARSFRT